MVAPTVMFAVSSVILHLMLGVLPQSLRDSSLKEGASVASLFEGGGFFAKAKKTEGVILHFAFITSAALST